MNDVSHEDEAPATAAGPAQSLEPWQARLLDENAELAARLERLHAMIADPAFPRGISVLDQVDLRVQFLQMQALSDTLERRISRFPGYAPEDDPTEAGESPTE